MREIKFVTITIKTNLTDDLYVNWDLLPSFNKNERIAIKEKRALGIKKDTVFGFVKHLVSNDIDISKLEITDLVLEELDKTELTIKDTLRFHPFYRKPYNNEKLIQVKLSEIKTLEENTKEKEEEINELLEEVNSMEDEIDFKKDEIKKLKVVN